VTLQTTLAFVAAFGLTTAAAPHALPIDRCTIVAVQMMDSVDSSTARPGDFFRFETVNAVTSGVAVAIPQRTMGYGVVAVAAPAGPHDARPGTLVLEPRYLVMPDGRHVGVVLNHNTDGLARAGANAGIPGYLGAIPVPGVGAAIGIFNYFRKGKNIVVPRGTLFTIFPNDDPPVEHCQDHPSY
jgi:hypothetical protein